MHGKAHGIEFRIEIDQEKQEKCSNPPDTHCKRDTDKYPERQAVQQHHRHNAWQHRRVPQIKQGIEPTVRIMRAQPQLTQ